MPAHALLLKTVCAQYIHPLCVHGSKVTTHPVKGINMEI